MQEAPREAARGAGGPMSFPSAKHSARRIVACILACTILPILNGCNLTGNGIGLGSQPLTLYWSVAVADVNGDGKTDVVASYTYSTNATSNQGFVAVFLQEPANPGKFLPPAKYRVGDHPMSMAIADLNGDDKLDIVTANTSVNGEVNNGSNNVSVLLQDPARPGQFLAASSYATGMFPNAVATGDLNGDGRPDLAVGDNTRVSVLFQSSTSPGTFLAPKTLATASPTSVAIADLNADKKADLVAVNGTSVAVFLQNEASPGTFSNPTTYGAGLQPTWAAIADFNGDGKPDLAVANQGAPSGGSGSVSVLLQDPASPGVFLSARDYTTLHGSNFVVISDLNGDGKLDLAAADLDRVSIFLQDSSVPGQFQAAVEYVSAIPVTSVAVGDLNGDGKPDLVMADSDGIVIRLQDPANLGVFLPQVIIAK
jgi:hypothetical protein